MDILFELMNQPVHPIFEQANRFFTDFADMNLLSAAGSSIAFALIPGARGSGTVPESILAGARRWHGGIDDRFAAIDNLVGLVESHQSWPLPPEWRTQLVDSRSRLQTLINRCRTPEASTVDRTLRNTLLASTVGLCLLNVRTWAYGQFAAGVLTTDDIHLLGFLLPGENGGHRDRTEATDALAEVKVTVINADFVHVVVDRSAGENAALVAHGWPPGVHHILIVIISVATGKEVFRQITTRLHNDVRMPEGSHGGQFIIKAAFLRHVDDEPRFGNEPTFSMPLTTEDLAAVLDRQHHENFDAQMREIERHRQEIERIQAELKAKK
jgi:hypothetical protein